MATIFKNRFAMFPKTPFPHFHLPNPALILILSFLLLLVPIFSGAQSTTEVMPPGSFVINMGVTPQTINNGIKPYGLIYSLITNFKIPVKWIIRPGKEKDAYDIIYNGAELKGGPFIIQAQYRSKTLNDTIAAYVAKGVVGFNTTSPIEVPVAMTLQFASVPRWTLDLKNGNVAIPYFKNAGIPPLAYNAPKTNPKLPSALGECDDIFVMPHAYPQWSSHSNLYVWNLKYKGSIWTSCTAGSELEDMFNPADRTQQANFLSEKDPAIAFPTGTVTTVENALLLYNHHAGGKPPYTYTNLDNPFMQFMGNIDAATQNGLEQIYIPKSGGWRPTTTIGIYDPAHASRYNLSNDPKYRAAIMAYGRGFGDPNRGFVMIEAAHSINSSSNVPANVAAQRAFFNFSFMSGKGVTYNVDITGIPTTIVTGTPTPVSFSFPPTLNSSLYIITWSSGCGGIFTENPAFPGDPTHKIFTPPSLTSTTSCTVSISIKDPCDRIFNTTQASVITTEMQIVTAIKSACYLVSDGTIAMTITGAAGPYNWSWTKSGGGTGSGTGLTIGSLAPGTYTVTVLSGGGTGSSKTFTVTISENPAIGSLSITPTNILCNGSATGSITVANVSGGTPPYSFLWSDAATTQNRSGLAANTYSVTATDASRCTVSSGDIVLSQPTAIIITPTVKQIDCNGQSTGEISLVVGGGTPGSSPNEYTYSWNDGATAKNRTGLAAGTYSVTVTDANNCKQTHTGMVISASPSALSLSASTVDVACNGGSTGSVNLTVSGGTQNASAPFYTYSWSNGATTEDISALTIGTYSVTVTDKNGCSAKLSKTIAQPTALSLSAAITKATCPGVSNGAVTITVTGGTTAYTYAWTGSGSTSATRTSLPAGSYPVTVTDGHSCTASTTAVVGNINPSPVQPGTITK
jgi:hypothetical protein